MRKIILFSVFMMMTFANGWCFGAEIQPKEWMSEPKTNFNDTQKLPKSSYREVLITKHLTAVDRLKEKVAIPLTEDMVNYFTGDTLKAKQGLKPFLVRGLYANETGVFSLFFKDGQLLVRHDSLGKNFILQFCPLVVNLPDEPKQVFIAVGGDE